MSSNPLDWYWFVGGTGPHIAAPGDPFTGDETKVFSSATLSYVPSTDPTYLAWRSRQMAENGGYDPTTRIDTEANLAAVLAPYGLAFPNAANAMAALAAMLNAKEGLGIHFTPTGGTDTVFPTDPNAVSKYTAVWNALNTTPPLAADGDIYIAQDGTPVPLSMADAKAMIQKALAYFRACTANYATLHAAVVANIQAVITTGWPSNS
jgi:hypothetical protein